MPQRSNKQPEHSALKPLAMGTDLIYVPRIARLEKKFGARFLKKLFTHDEIEILNQPSPSQSNPLQSVLPAELTQTVTNQLIDLLTEKQRHQWHQKIAARIATKEAVSKALSVGLNGLSWGQGIAWHSVEVVSTAKSPPQIVLSGRALELFQSGGYTQWQVSWSHDGDYVVSTVLAH
ncbi:MAG: holo-ACP synthase [Cyanobacteria bacterium P01_H01_bin.74]